MDLFNSFLIDLKVDNFSVYLIEAIINSLIKYINYIV